MQLTDAMIESALENTVYMKQNPWIMIAILCAVVLFLTFLFFKAQVSRQKIIAGALAGVFVLIGCATLPRNIQGKKHIENGEWYVVTATVDRVMEATKDGKKRYYAVLDKYGSISLANYAEAMKYYAGEAVYVVVIPDSDGYKSTGITYKTADYTYEGSHQGLPE